MARAMTSIYLSIVCVLSFNNSSEPLHNIYENILSSVCLSQDAQGHSMDGVFADAIVVSRACGAANQFGEDGGVLVAEARALADATVVRACGANQLGEAQTLSSLARRS